MPNKRIVITKTPVRLTFAGGGTDIPAYYEKHGPGAVVSAAISKYIYITVGEHFYHDEIRVSYSKTENALRRVDDIQHPTVRESMRLLGIRSGVQIVSVTEIPSGGTGLGSSSSFLVGLLNALHVWKGDSPSSKQLAEEAVHIEREVLGEPGGKQDQYIAAYGGVQFMEFNRDGSVAVKPVPMTAADRDALGSRIMLMYTGRQRESTQIHAGQSKGVHMRVDSYDRMRDLAYDTYKALLARRFDSVGKILHDNWNVKRTLADGISDSAIDGWYERALAAGAMGGKIIGAGGGGFLMLFAKPGDHRRIAEALPELVPMKFGLEADGSKVIYSEDT